MSTLLRAQREKQGSESSCVDVPPKTHRESHLLGREVRREDGRGAAEVRLGRRVGSVRHTVDSVDQRVAGGQWRRHGAWRAGSGAAEGGGRWRPERGVRSRGHGCKSCRERNGSLEIQISGRQRSGWDSPAPGCSEHFSFYRLGYLSSAPKLESHDLNCRTAVMAESPSPKQCRSDILFAHTSDSVCCVCLCEEDEPRHTLLHCMLFSRLLVLSSPPLRPIKYSKLHVNLSNRSSARAQATCVS